MNINFLKAKAFTPTLKNHNNTQKQCHLPKAEKFYGLQQDSVSFSKNLSLQGQSPQNKDQKPKTDSQGRPKYIEDLAQLSKEEINKLGTFGYNKETGEIIYRPSVKLDFEEKNEKPYIPSVEEEYPDVSGTL